MTPIEFVLWMNGAMGVLDGPPTEAQWAAIKEKMGEAVGGIVAKRLLEGAEEAFHIRQKQLRDEAEKESYVTMMKQKQAAAMHELMAKQKALGYNVPAGMIIRGSAEETEFLSSGAAASGNITGRGR